ncbi:MAG TPA: sulfotransferase [Candidatus Sulfotelmatobacter sp.]|jgi:LPS sulfotransferase NodH
MMQTAPAIAISGEQANARSLSPVFVVGSPRSGTTLLYHMLLSAGNFAIYRTESSVLNLLEPRFGDLSVARNRRRLLHAWVGSKLFTASGLDQGEIAARIMAECRNGGDFLRIVMSEIARKQGVQRWADTTPEHLLYLRRIKETIPDALVIHMIRDGRDVALSSDKLQYIRRLWWDRSPSRMAAGLHWQWMVAKGRKDGRALGADYTEVRFEDLVRDPAAALARIGEFIAQELDYDLIRKAGIGSVSEPNTSFAGEANFDPIERWKSGYSKEELAMFEALVGKTLTENGYALVVTENHLAHRASVNLMRTSYTSYFRSKLFLKTKTPLGRWLVTRDLSWI